MRSGPGHLDDEVHPIRRNRADPGDDVQVGVSQYVLRAGRGGEGCLRRAADRGDDGCPRPPGELDRGMPDRACPAGHEHDPAGQGTRMQSARPVFGHGQRAVRRDRRHPEARALVEGRSRRQQEDTVGGKHRVFLGRAAVRPLVRGERQPDPVAHSDVLHSDSDRLHEAGAVLSGHNVVKRQGLTRRRAAARLPVGRVHAADHNANPHLAGARFVHRPIDELEHGRVTGQAVHNGFHVRHNVSGGGLFPSIVFPNRRRSPFFDSQLHHEPPEVGRIHQSSGFAPATPVTRSGTASATARSRMLPTALPLITSTCTPRQVGTHGLAHTPEPKKKGAGTLNESGPQSTESA